MSNTIRKRLARFAVAAGIVAENAAKAEQLAATVANTSKADFEREVEERVAAALANIALQQQAAQAQTPATDATG
jgi:hypothetical protein